MAVPFRHASPLFAGLFHSGIVEDLTMVLACRICLSSGRDAGAAGERYFGARALLPGPHN
jgi:hypothetical protein